MSNIPQNEQNEGDQNFFLYIHIYIYGKILSYAHPPKWGDSLQRVCRQTILDIPFTFQRPCIQTVVQQIVDLWQYVASGLCNHKPSGVSHDCAIMTICNKWIVQSQSDKSFGVSHN